MGQDYNPITGNLDLLGYNKRGKMKSTDLFCLYVYNKVSMCKKYANRKDSLWILK
jgi:hypothetical protein